VTEIRRIRDGEKIPDYLKLGPNKILSIERVPNNDGGTGWHYEYVVELVADTEEPRYVFVEGDARCGSEHKQTGAVCLLPKGHEGDHRNTQGYWL